MLGKRRPPPRIVFLLSLLLGVLALIPAYRYAIAENWLPTALWGTVAVWLMVDAVRSYGWMKNAQTQAEQVSLVPQPGRGEFMVQPETPSPAQPESEQSGLRPNPLLRSQAAVQEPDTHPDAAEAQLRR